MMNGKTVVIVTSNNSIFHGLQKVLEAKGYSVKTYSFESFSPATFQDEFTSAQNPIVLMICPSTLTLEREIGLIRSLRISRQLPEDARKVPIIMLSFDCMDNLIRRRPSNVLLLSPGCVTLQMPFRREKLWQLVSEAASISRFDRLKEFLLPGNRLVEIEVLDKHALSNLLGPIHLLRGACAAGEIPEERANPVYTILREKLAQTDYYGEYLDLLSVVSPLPPPLFSSGKPPDKKLSDEIQGKQLRVLLIDDEWDKGWADVLKEILVPDTSWDNNAGIPYRRAQKGGVTFDCLTDLNALAQVLGRKHRKEWRNFIEYDLVLLDLRLKGEDPRKNIPIEEISGYQLLKDEIRYRDPTVPVIMFTASERAKFIQALQQLGIAGYFVKPHSRGDDEVCRENFERLKFTILNAVEKHYLRQFWERTIHLKSAVSQMGFDQEHVSNLRSLLEAAYFKIQDAYPRTPQKQYYYNVAILLYHQCLETFAAAHGINPREDNFIQQLSEKAPTTKKQEVQSGALTLNNLRNEYAHPQYVAQSQQGKRTAKTKLIKKIREADENKAIEAFKCIAQVINAFPNPTPRKE